jgi:hypothetical protein
MIERKRAFDWLTHHPPPTETPEKKAPKKRKENFKKELKKKGLKQVKHITRGIIPYSL